MTVAVVTGASRGLGRAIAVEAANRGFDVVLASRSDPADTAAEVEAAGRRCWIHRGDLADARVVDALAATARRVGHVALLVNNAGVANSGPLSELTAASWNETIALNLSAPAWLSIRLADDLRATNGSIVNIGSTGGVIGSVHSLPYGSSKAGLIGLTKTLARMLAPDVRVNALCPGPVATELLAGVGAERLNTILADTPLGRLGDPTEIARAALDVSEWTYCTGQAIVVDGGRVMQ